MNKLALGTAQFGLNYGVNNQRGIIPKKEAFAILDFANKNKIDMLDTAHDYGKSEDVLGEYLASNKNHFQIISKLPTIERLKPGRDLTSTLKKLHQLDIYGYFFHHFSNFADNPGLLDQLILLKSEGKIKKIGFSLYFIEELEYLLDKNIEFDIVQVPYNIFDRRFENYFSKLENLNKEIYVRSIFLQGLFFKPLESLKGRFMKIIPKILLLNDMAKKLNTSSAGVCLNFCYGNKYIDKIIIGIDSLSNLEENCSSISEKIYKLPKKIYRDLQEDDENILLPINWNGLI